MFSRQGHVVFSDALDHSTSRSKVSERRYGLDLAFISAGYDNDLEDEHGDESNSDDREEELLEESPHLLSRGIVINLRVDILIFECDERIISVCSIVHFLNS